MIDHAVIPSGSEGPGRAARPFAPPRAARSLATLGMTLLVLVFFAACAQKKPADPAPAQTSAPAPAAAGPRIILPDGFVVDVEVANTDELRAQGLMYRDRLPAGKGMIFFFAQDGVYPFWMKNTMIPLDMIWVDAAHRVAHVKSNVPPCRVDPCPSYDPEVPARYVVELAGGEAGKHALKAGDQLRFEGMDNVTVR
jgi:uncharacterized protein